MAPKTWLITGCSSGFGENFVHKVLQRGDKAIATARGDVSRLSALKEAGAYVYSLDITSPPETIKSTIDTIVEEVGGIDVLVNNAGYLKLGVIEALDIKEWHNIFEANFFGPLKMVQAVLPHFRARRSGDVVFISSMFGLQGSAGSAAYATTKFAIEGLHDALKDEVAGFGIRSFIFAPGAFRTSVAKTSLTKPPTNDIEDYKPVEDFSIALAGKINGNQTGDPKKAINIMIDFVKGEGVAQGKTVPNRLLLGSETHSVVMPKILAMTKDFEEWDGVIKSTDFDGLTEVPEYIKMLQAAHG